MILLLYTNSKYFGVILMDIILHFGVILNSKYFGVILMGGDY